MTTRMKVWVIIVLFIAAAIGLVLVKLAREVQEKETLGIDKQILLSIHAHATPVLDAIIVRTTDMGSPMFVIIVAVLLGAWLWYKKHIYRFTVLASCMIGSALFTFAIKQIIERPRPALWSDQLVHETGFSFISGHATMSMTLVLALIVMLWQTKWRWAMVCGGLVYAAYVSFTRLYLGVHYPTDIAGGWMVAVTWTMIAVLAIQVVRERKKST